ncbi:GntR family transcriptional regulator [Pseudomonas lini]|uniref:GntR family transcriptional regulator n=1 Tax=Pseudomonas lini TaxID=163011 RepID=UPI00345EF441
MNSFASPQIFTALPFSRTDTGKPPADDLYSRIFDAILEQRISPSSRFTEESLGHMFGVSRSTVRRVLSRLSHQQVIILRPNQRPRVAAPTPEQTRQVLHARRLSESTLVQLACQRRHSGMLVKLRELAEEQRQCMERGLPGTAIRLSGEFHLQLANMADNAPLAHFLGSLVPLTSLAIAQFEHQPNSHCTWREHKTIVDAVESADVKAAVRLMSEHLDHLEQRLLQAR